MHLAGSTDAASEYTGPFDRLRAGSSLLLRMTSLGAINKNG